MQMLTSSLSGGALPALSGLSTETPGRGWVRVQARAPDRVHPFTPHTNLVDKMDRKTKRWDWLPAHMPEVSRMMADRRRELGDEWVNRCWTEGVVRQQPGWFFASEGPLMVGMPWADSPDIIRVLTGRITPTQALLILRPKEGQAHG